MLAAILLVLILPPSLFLITASVHTTKPNGAFDQLTLQYYGQIFTSRHFAGSLINTVLFSIGSAVVAIVLGLTQALIVERTNAPGRQYVFLGSVISLGIPHVLQTVGWLLLLGKSGPVNDFLKWLTGAMAPPLNVYSIWGMILIEGVSFVPLTFLLMSAVLKAIDTSFEEAAMASGARPLRTFLTVTVPMCLPGVMALLLLVFIRAFESFEVPALVGLAGNITVLTTNIYQSAKDQGANFGMSGAYSVLLLAMVVALLYFYNKLSQHAHRYQTITGKGFRPRTVDLGVMKWAASLLLFTITVVIVVLPIGMVAFASLQPFYAGITPESFSLLTLDNYATVLKPGSFRDAIGNTLLMAAATATMVVPFTALCAWLAARRYNGAWFLDQLATAPLVFPAIVMSVAYLHVYVNAPIGLYGTLLSVIIASAARFLPYGMRYSYAGVLQIHPELEQASAISGARQTWTFVRIVLPLISAALISCWLFIFLVASREVSLPLMLVGPGVEIVGPTLFDLWQNGAVTELAAMGVLWVILMTFVSAILHVIATRYGINARA
jgi:iron(III) transport system permease protein